MLKPNLSGRSVTGNEKREGLIRRSEPALRVTTSEEVDSVA